jgi:hypothetical protein
MKTIKDANSEKMFDAFGGFDTIREIQDEVIDREDNFDSYYEEVKKYNILKQLYDLFGQKVLEKTDKYDYKKLNKEMLHTYWNDKVNNVGIDNDAKYDCYYLLDGLKEDVKEWDVSPDVGLPFYNSRWMTKICTGWDFGNLYIYGGFGGSGKTSLTFNKIIMSCIENQEKLLIIANEQGIKEFRKLLVATALGIKEIYLKRQRLNEGSFSEEEKNKLNNAIEWIDSFAKGNNKLIAFAFMEDYIMSDVKKIIKRFAMRGYKSVMIDTGKPSDGNAAERQRWEIFTEDFKQLYKLCRPNGGGLNLRMWVNVQLADTALTRRYLNEHAFGESKKIKNEASVVFMGRSLWDDEYEGGDKEIIAFKWTKVKADDPNNPFADEGELVRKEFKLPRYYEKDGKKHENQYYLIFTPKNRRGQDNKNGQDILIMRANFNSNTWTEVGWTKIIDDKNY